MVMLIFCCRYDPESDGRVLLGNVDCTEEPALCRRYDVDVIFNDLVVLVYIKFGYLF